MIPTFRPLTYQSRHRTSTKLALLVFVMAFISVSHAQDPFAGVKISVTPLQSYSGGSALPKPTKVLVYDFAVDTSSVQVDQSQKMRPRHMIAKDENPEAVAKRASATFSDELMSRLAKIGIPAERATADITEPENALLVQGSFLALNEGDKAERVGVGMGTGTAEVQAKVDLRLKRASDSILVSQFQTDTDPRKGMGVAAPAAAGVDPAAVAVKAKVSDRKKTLQAYAGKTADAMAEEIAKEMAKQGWVKLNDKGEVIQ